MTIIIPSLDLEQTRALPRLEDLPPFPGLQRPPTNFEYGRDNFAIPVGGCQHIAVTTEDREGPDSSAEALIRNWGLNPDNGVASWNDTIDRDSWVPFLPTTVRPWQQGTDEYGDGIDWNEALVGQEMAIFDTDWNSKPAFVVEEQLQMSAAVWAVYFGRFGWPIIATLDRARLVELVRRGESPGLTGHYVIDPNRRRDPGVTVNGVDTFPWDRLLGKIHDELAIRIQTHGKTEPIKEPPIMAKPAPTRAQIKEFLLEWKALGGEWYCTPWDWEAGRCKPGLHGHSSDSYHFKGLAGDFGWPGPAVSAMEALAVQVFIRHIDRTKPYDVRWLFNISSTNHPDHGHGDAGEYAGAGWYDDVRDRGKVLARDGVDLFLPTTFSWHIPPTNLGFTIGKTVKWQSKMKRAIRPSTGKPYYSGRVDGYHGEGSKQGTRDFQKDQGLTQDAKFGAKTTAAMDAFLADSGKSTDQKRYDAIVKMLEDAGLNVTAYVTEVQKMLLAAGYDPKGVDGSPGSGFQEALGRFQKDHDLKVDYLPGKKTWDALVKASTPVPTPPAVEPPVVTPEPEPEPEPTDLEKRVAELEAVNARLRAALKK